MAYVTISVIAATLVSLVAFRQLLGKCAQPILSPLPPLPPASYTRHVQTRRRRSRTAYLSAILFRQAGIICATSVTFPPSSKKSFPSPFPFIGHGQIITVSAQSSPGKKLGRDGKLLFENTFIHPFA